MWVGFVCVCVHELTCLYVIVFDDDVRAAVVVRECEIEMLAFCFLFFSP